MSNSKNQQVSTMKVKFVDDDNTKKQVIYKMIRKYHTVTDEKTLSTCFSHCRGELLTFIPDCLESRKFKSYTAVEYLSFTPPPLGV